MSQKPKTEAPRPTSGQTEAADTRNAGFKAAAAKGKAALGAKFAADPQPKQSVGIRRVKMTIDLRDSHVRPALETQNSTAAASISSSSFGMSLAFAEE